MDEQTIGRTPEKPLLVHAIPALTGGGAEREVARVCRVLSEKSPFRVIVCCLWEGGVFVDDVRKAGVEVEILFPRKRSSILTAWQFLRWLRCRKPAIVHMHLIRWGPIVARLAGVPGIIVTVHNWWPNPKTHVVVPERVSLYFADKIVAVADLVKRQLLEIWHTPVSKTMTILPSIEPQERMSPEQQAAKRADLGIPPDAPIICNIGRLVEQKAQKYFIEAAAHVLKSRSDCRFLIIGEGDLHEELDRQIIASELEDRVFLMGFRDDVRQILQVANLMCLSSDWEGTPMAMLEAMALSKPVVATAVGGCPMIVRNGKTGFIVPPCNPSALADAMLKIINDPEFAERLGNSALELLQAEYSAERNLAQYRELYVSIMKHKGLENTSNLWRLD